MLQRYDGREKDSMRRNRFVYKWFSLVINDEEKSMMRERLTQQFWISRKGSQVIFDELFLIIYFYSQLFVQRNFKLHYVTKRVKFVG